MRIFEHTSVTVRLNASEQYKADTPTGPIQVDHITISGSSNRAKIRGTAIKKDGTAALHDREGHADLTELPIPVLLGVMRFLNKGRVPLDD